MTLNKNSKVLIVGTSGSGKSTLARKISKKLNIADIELDAIYWKENWTGLEPYNFKQKLLETIDGKTGFVIHGNYKQVQDIILNKSDTVIWLDYSLIIVMWRVFKRSVLRIIKNETLWAGNKETFKKTFLSKDSIILWAWNTYHLRKQRYQELIENTEYKNLQIIRFTKPKQARAFIESIDL